jgi:hypothetical protein
MDNYRSESVPDLEPLPAGKQKGGARRFALDVLETLLLSLVLFLGINAISARIRIESISIRPRCMPVTRDRQ